MHRLRGQTRLGVIGSDLAVGGRDQAVGAASVVAPAVRVRIFLAGMMEAGHLILEACAVALLDDGGRDEDQEIALGADIRMLLESVADKREVAQHRDFVMSFGDLVLKQTADREGVPLLMRTVDSMSRVSMTGLLTVAPWKVKTESATLLEISGFTLRVTKSSLLIEGVTWSVLP